MKRNIRAGSRVPTWLWIPAAAVLLLIVLGVLQFRWLSELSERERESRQARLAADVQRFGEDFDREVMRAYFTFQLDADAVERRDGRDATARYELWKTQSRYPRLVRDIWIAEPLSESPPDVRQTSWRYLHVDVRKHVIAEEALPPALDGLRQRLAASLSQDARVLAEHDPFLNPIDEGTLSILAPLVVSMPLVEPPQDPAATGAPFMGATQAPAPATRFAIVQLDREYIMSELLPMLSKQYFNGTRAAADFDYHVAILRNQLPNTLVYASHSTSDGRLPTAIDATATFFGIGQTSAISGEMTAANSASNDGHSSSGSIRAVDASFSPGISQLWRLRVTHRSGSLEIFAEQTLRQNLIASCTILVLLAGSVVLMLVALRRSRALTRQQMEFVAGISHELRTPVAVVCMTGANLADGLVSDAEQVRRYGRLVQREGRRLMDMTEQVLNFARIESASLPAPEPIAVDTLIHSAIESMQPQMDEQAFRCLVSVDRSVPRLLVDRASIERAIKNLISNALKFSADHREIRITAGTETRGATTRVWIAVEDGGIGISADELAVIFEPFRRGRDAIERNLPGTGLGLSLVRRIMQLHGGSVEVRSQHGAGSTFTLFLPAAERSSPTDSATSS